ncbi:CidA/LrgA family protein [Colwelliaceae bacterium 6471]
MMKPLRSIIDPAYSVGVIFCCLYLGKFVSATAGGLPGSLYGMILFSLVLHTNIVSADKIKNTVAWIIQHMGVCFVPAGVGIINHFELIKQFGLSIVAIIFISTFALLTTVGLSYEHFALRKNGEVKYEK